MSWEVGLIRFWVRGIDSLYLHLANIRMKSNGKDLSYAFSMEQFWDTVQDRDTVNMKTDNSE